MEDNPILGTLYSFLRGKKWLLIVLAVIFSLMVILATVTNLLEFVDKLFRKENLSDYVSITSVEIYYYSTESLERTIPDVVRPGGLIPTDDQSQLDFWRLYSIRLRPIIKATVSNTHPSKKIVVENIFLKVDNQEYWWQINTSFGVFGIGAISCAPSSQTTITGVPTHLPYNPTLEVRNEFEKFNLERPPIELWGVLKIVLADGSDIVSQSPIRISKEKVKEYLPREEL